MPLTATDPRRIYNPVQKDAAVFVETVAETGGERTVLDVELAPGGGNRPHTHETFAEHFECLEGELTVRLGDQVHRLKPGETATAPPQALHCFANETDETVHFRVTLHPGHRGFEQALQIAYGLASDGLTHEDGLPKSVLHLALLMSWSDTRGTGFVRVIEKVMRPLAAVARRRGVDRQLVERYCRY
jgi:quercetin dioxygenase-like cupin family protein